MISLYIESKGEILMTQQMWCKKCNTNTGHFKKHIPMVSSDDNKSNFFGRVYFAIATRGASEYMGLSKTVYDCERCNTRIEV